MLLKHGTCKKNLEKEKKKKRMKIANTKHKHKFAHKMNDQ